MERILLKWVTDFLEITGHMDGNREGFRKNKKEVYCWFLTANKQCAVLSRKNSVGSFSIVAMHSIQSGKRTFYRNWTQKVSEEESGKPWRTSAFAELKKQTWQSHQWLHKRDFGCATRLGLVAGTLPLVRLWHVWRLHWYKLKKATSVILLVTTEVCPESLKELQEIGNELSSWLSKWWVEVAANKTRSLVSARSSVVQIMSVMTCVTVFICKLLF